MFLKIRECLLFLTIDELFYNIVIFSAIWLILGQFLWLETEKSAELSTNRYWLHHLIYFDQVWLWELEKWENGFKT